MNQTTKMSKDDSTFIKLSLLTILILRIFDCLLPSFSYPGFILAIIIYILGIVLTIILSVRMHSLIFGICIGFIISLAADVPYLIITAFRQSGGLTIYDWKVAIAFSVIFIFCGLISSLASQLFSKNKTN